MSVHVMNPEEVHQARLDDLKQCFKATMQKCQMCQVNFTPDDQLEEEAAFKQSCQGNDSEGSEPSA
jgi:hypothetical protein